MYIVLFADVLTLEPWEDAFRQGVVVAASSFTALLQSFGAQQLDNIRPAATLAQITLIKG
ncbi:hypothetical protein P367_12430 [Comamonas thiooxydans]|nr:hypothetical protein P369_09525 [Comamonas thiooxydans]KGG98572.1 hypothetical protein P367_12430 [Comamonas thiooxydans]